MYLISSPDVVFVRFINLQINTGTALANPNTWWWLIFRNYALDMLWGYSLVFAVYLIIDNNTAGWQVLLLTFVFSTFIEAIQLYQTIPGTFDLLDIIAEGIAEIIAVIIIKNMRRLFKK